MTDSIFSMTNHELYVITAVDGDRRSGQIATWVLPGTLAHTKGRLIAVISPLNFTDELIAASGRFTVQMLADDQAAFLPRFGLVSGRTEDKFAGLALDTSPAGLPLLRGTCGWTDCVVRGGVDTGDRHVYIADITAHRRDAARRPLRMEAAFAAQPPDVRARLEEKARIDGERSEALWRDAPGSFRTPRSMR